MQVMYVDALADARRMVTMYKTVGGLKKRMMQAIEEDGDKAGFSVNYDLKAGRMEVYRNRGHTVAYTPGYQATVIVPNRYRVNADDSLSCVDMLYCEKTRGNGNRMCGGRVIRENGTMEAVEYREVA